MGTDLSEWVAHPLGEQPEVEEWSTVADTFAGRVHIEWDTTASATPLGQLPFFIEYLKQGGLFDGWVADCPLSFTSPNAPRKRDVLGTLLLSVLAGHRRYAHVTALRCDAVNPPLLGMSKVVSEDALRRALAKIDETAGAQWLQAHLDYCVRPLLAEPWVLDVDATIKPLYGHQEGAVVGYNPRKPGRPSHCYHTYMLSDLRLVLRVEVLPGDQHNPKHAAAGLWSLLARLGRERWPRLLRGDAEWGNEAVMARAEREGLPYLFRLRATANVKRALERAMAERDWSDAGQGWQGKETNLRLIGWSRQRRVVLLRRKFNRPLAASVALIYNWWSLFVRLADPDHHREVITSRPLLLQAIARKTQHAGRTTLTVSSTHGEQQAARRAYVRIAQFFAQLREKAEQLDAVQRWYRILSEALRRYLQGRQLTPPARLQPV